MNSDQEKIFIGKLGVVSNGTPRRVAIVTMYTVSEYEKAIASIKVLENDTDTEILSVKRFAILSGEGERFVLPQTRLELVESKFWKGVMEGAFIRRRCENALMKMGKLSWIGDDAVRHVCSVNRINSDVNDSFFTELTKEERAVFKKEKATKNAAAGRPAKDKGKASSSKKSEASGARNKAVEKGDGAKPKPKSNEKIMSEKKKEEAKKAKEQAKKDVQEREDASPQEDCSDTEAGSDSDEEVDEGDSDVDVKDDQLSFHDYMCSSTLSAEKLDVANLIKRKPVWKLMTEELKSKCFLVGDFAMGDIVTIIRYATGKKLKTCGSYAISFPIKGFILDSGRKITLVAPTDGN